MALWSFLNGGTLDYDVADQAEQKRATRTATCQCGAVTAECIGEPVRVSVCHCLDCQRRTGSAFAVQARFNEAAVTVTGVTSSSERAGDSGRMATYRFCPKCGATICYSNEGMDGLLAIPVGAFANPAFPRPKFSFYEIRRHPWVDVLGETVERCSH